MVAPSEYGFGETTLVIADAPAATQTAANRIGGGLQHSTTANVMVAAQEIGLVELVTLNPTPTILATLPRGNKCGTALVATFRTVWRKTIMSNPL